MLLLSPYEKETEKKDKDITIAYLWREKIPNHEGAHLAADDAAERGGLCRTRVINFLRRLSTHSRRDQVASARQHPLNEPISMFFVNPFDSERELQTPRRPERNSSDGMTLL